MQEFLTRDKLPMIFGILGFILAVLFFRIGFFKTILLILITIRSEERRVGKECFSL